MASSGSLPASDALDALRPFTSCDVADALVQLGHLSCFVPDLVPLSRMIGAKVNAFPLQKDQQCAEKVIGFVFPVAFGGLGVKTEQPPHYMDHPEISPGDVIVIKASYDSVPHAVWGGLVGTRAQARGVQGAIIEGRIRDTFELWKMGNAVWSQGTSSLGAAKFGRVVSISDPITLNADSANPVMVRKGDIVVADTDGVVIFPPNLLTDVVDRCGRIVSADEQCKTAIQSGSRLTDAFAQFRK